MTDPRAPSSVRNAFVAMTLLAGVGSLVNFIRTAPPYLADFTVFWTAARFAAPYDAEGLTRAQLWLLPPDPGLRPFAYPPTALLLMKPLAWLDYSAAAALWTALGIALFAAACTLYGRRGLAALLGPMFALTILIGQASLFAGAMLAAGVALLKDRPAVAGVLLGLLGAVKPQVAVLVPLALICARQWSALAAAAAAGAVAVLASLALGPQLWAEWLHSLGGFNAQVQGESFRAMNMAPGPTFAPLGVLCAAYVWMRTERPELRLPAVAAGACLCVPYIGNYDLVAIAPAGAMLLIDRDWRGWVVGFFALVVLWLSPFAILLGTAYLAYREAGLRVKSSRSATS